LQIVTQALPHPIDNDPPLAPESAPAPEPPHLPTAPLPDLGRVKRELPAYLAVQAAWFVGFGLQMVLFPYLAANILRVGPDLLGVAQMSLSAPSLVFLLFGGVIAEQWNPRRLMITLHSMAWIPAIVLASMLARDNFAYWMMIAYGLVMGTIGAFILPARDAILSEIIARRMRLGKTLTLQQGVAMASLAQFGAQVVGLGLGGLASVVGPAPLLVGQAFCLGIGALGAKLLCKPPPRPQDDARTPPLKAIGEGLAIVRRSDVLAPMTLSMLAIGVFVIGSFLVVLPILNRDVYHMRSTGLGLMFIAFWTGAFVSSAALTGIAHVARPGRLMLIAQSAGVACISALLLQPPFWLFLVAIFAWGLAAGVSVTTSRAIVQEAAPPTHLARVLSIYQLGFMGGAPIGSILMGFATAKFGPQGAAIIPAIGLAVMIALMATQTPIWRMDRPKPA